MKKLGLFSLLVLVVVLLSVWSAVLGEERGDILEVVFLDVGQGDATLVIAPSGKQVLIDGGPDRSVLRELSRYMPWYDRSIDVVIATHPDTDHVGGLFEVLKRYKVDYILRPGIQHDAPAAESLLLRVASEGAEERLARRGQIIDLGQGVYIEILFPDRDVSGVEPNIGSVILRVVYGETSFLLTGDAPDGVEEYLVRLDGERLESDVLKVGHHGSKTSSALLFVGYVDPEYGVISRGCGNSYGHPHEEVLGVYERLNIELFDTCEHDSVVFLSDGRQVFTK